MEQFLFSMGRIGFLLILLSGACTPLQKDVPQTSLPTTCIQGTVLYRLPADTDPLPYARVKVAAWRQGTDRALAETETNEKGRYCIEVPMTPSGVDLRVWGMRTVEYDKYVCKGSADDIDVGSVSQRCGTGGCPTVDITTECNRYVSPRRLK
jgi:hypothetical protein